MAYNAVGVKFRLVACEYPQHGTLQVYRQRIRGLRMREKHPTIVMSSADGHVVEPAELWTTRMDNNGSRDRGAACGVASNRGRLLHH